jgi:hypothetical protein
LLKRRKLKEHKAELAIKAKKAGKLGAVASGKMKLHEAAKKAPPASGRLAGQESAAQV